MGHSGQDPPNIYSKLTQDLHFHGLAKTKNRFPKKAMERRGEKAREPDAQAKLFGDI